MKGIRLLLLLALPLCTSAQNTFLKTYSEGYGYDNFNDLVQVSANEYAFITEALFYRIDQNGSILLKKDLKEGLSTYLESLTIDHAGNFYIAAQVFNSVSDASLVLYKLNSNGQVLLRKPIAALSTRDLKIVRAGNNRLYAVYIEQNGSADPYPVILLLDEQGQELWRSALRHHVYNRFTAHAGANGTLEMAFTTSDHHTTWLIQADSSGNMTETEILLPYTAGTDSYVSDFFRAPDGGYVFAGEKLYGNNQSNGLLYKTDRTGHLQWSKEINIFKGDRFIAITGVADGYLVLANSGFTNDWGNSVNGDIVLLKTDWQGTLEWKKGLGSAKADYAHTILPAANSVLIGGKVSWPGYTASIPTIIKTDQRGSLQTILPFQLTRPNIFTHVRLGGESAVQTLAKVVHASDGSLIAGSNLPDSTNDNQVYPFIFTTSEAGHILWHKKLTTVPGLLKALISTRDGHYLALTEHGSFLGTSAYFISKFNGGGDIVWASQLGASMLRDMIATADGGYLLTGAEDLTLSNFDLLLIKADANGREVWRKKTGISSQWEMAKSIKETPEHDFIIAGNSQRAFGEASNAYVVKVNNNGNVLWTQSIGTGTGQSMLYDIAITNNGYVMTGSSSPQLSDEKDVLTICLDKQGNLIWEKTYHLHLQDVGLSVHYTSDDTILVGGSAGEPAAGNLEKYGFLMKLNKNGIKQSVQYFGTAGVRTSVEKIMVTNDEVLLAGNTEDEYGEGHMFFTKAGIGAAPPPEDPVTGALVIYPNPTYSKAFISLKNDYTGPANIVLYNTTGQQVMVFQLKKSGFELKEELPLTGLASGMYYLFIQQGSNKSMKRLEILNR